MQVSRIHMQGFMPHKDTEVSLPDRGLVLITGPNGSGKSSFVEAVAVAGWGKTLRGTNPWSGKGSASIVTDQVDARRSYNGRSKQLAWRKTDQLDDPADFETTTKAQEALESLIGSFDIWRRTSVFSSQDAAHFTMATDAERKRLLESLLGLGRFDTALAACRSDRKEADMGLRSATTLLDQLKAQRDSAGQRLADARKVLETVPPAVDDAAVKARRAELGRLLTSARADITAANSTAHQLDRKVAQLEASGRELQRRLKALGDGDCDNCGQPIPEVLIDRLQGEADEAVELATVAREAAGHHVLQIADEVEEVQEEVEDLQAKVAKMDEQIRTSVAVHKQRKTAEEAVAGAEAALAGLDDRIANGDTKVLEMSAKLAVLEATEQVLGTKGVRAHVLGRALSGIELAANAWLARIVGFDDPYETVEDDPAAAAVEAALGGRMCLRLRPYSEKKSGGVSDAIGMEVIGAGGGYGYKAASGGERRRIDVSLLLALAEVAQAAHGTQGGTIFIDEAMDSLDAEGVDRVSTVLSDMAQDRTVVVISHNPDLQRALNPAAWFEVNNGSVTQLL